MLGKSVSFFLFLTVAAQRGGNGSEGQPCLASTICRSGLRCWLPVRLVDRGICVASRVKEGGLCASDKRRGTLSCEQGLQCVTLPTSRPGDKFCSGLKAKLGETCGEFSPTSKTCEDNLVCLMTDFRLPDLGGKCVASIAQENEVCGSNSQQIRNCTTGLECLAKTTNSTEPTLLSEPRTCIRPKAKLGEVCEAFAINSKHCEEGLVCLMTNFRLPDIGGTCVLPIAQANEVCGSATDQIRNCTAGFECLAKTTNTTEPTLPEPRICIKPKAKLGENCGEFSLTSKTCEEGLICLLKDFNLPDLGGKCAAPIAQENEVCGSNSEQIRNCTTGLECLVKPSSDGENTFRPPRVCLRKPAILGESCGGFTANARPCGPNLFCLLDNFKIPDAGGHCVPAIGKLNDVCGSEEDQFRNCTQELDCRRSPTTPAPNNIPAAKFCLRPSASLNERCNPRTPCVRKTICLPDDFSNPRAGGKCVSDVASPGEICSSTTSNFNRACSPGHRCINVGTVEFRCATNGAVAFLGSCTGAKVCGPKLQCQRRPPGTNVCKKVLGVKCSQNSECYSNLCSESTCQEEQEQQ